MENELTPQLQMPYPKVRLMDENTDNGEVKLGADVKESQDLDEDLEKKTKLSSVSKEQQEKARKSWEEELRKQRERGIEIPEEAKKQIEAIIGAGIPYKEGPLSIGGGSTDPYFENFPTEKFKDTAFEGLADELKELGLRNEATDDILQRMAQVAREMEGAGSATGDLAHDFIEEISKARVAREQGLPYGAEEESIDSTPLTQEAIDLIKTVDTGGTPSTITGNLRRIAEENNINITSDMTPADVIEALRAKLGASGSGNPPGGNPPTARGNEDSEEPEENQPLTQEALSLLQSADVMSVPMEMNDVYRRIAEENGIAIDSSTTPQGIINELRARQAGGEGGEPPTRPTAEGDEEELPEDTNPVKVQFNQYRTLVRDLSDPLRAGDLENTVDQLRAIETEITQPFSDDRRAEGRIIQDWRAAFGFRDPAERARRLNEVIDKAEAKKLRNIAEGKEEVPQEIVDIQGLSKFIMSRQESALYGRDKKFALIEFVEETDPETGNIREREIFRPDNFLIWVRDQIMQLHDDNPASEMQPLAAVAIETQLRNVSIYMMNRFRGQYFRDAETGQIMNELADEAVNMCYLFGFFRNMDLAYKQAMKSDDELPKTIVGIHAKNDVTRGSNWASFLSMPDKFSFGKETMGADGVAQSEKDTKVGDAVLVANDIYYNLSDIDEIIKIVGQNGAFVTKEGFRKTLFLQQILDGQKYEWDDGPDEKEGFYDKTNDNFYFINQETGQKRNIFNNDGSLNRANFLTFINFQNEPTANKSKVDFVRDLVRLSIAEKVKIDTGFASKSNENGNPSELDIRHEAYNKNVREKGLAQADSEYRRLVKASRINSQFAEYSSYVEQRPLMVAARNDTNRRGYDAATKLNVLNYLVRQSGENTAGPIGNPEFLKEQIIKNLAVDFVAGLKTENGRSPYEIFHEMREVLEWPEYTPEQRKTKENAKTRLMSQLRFQEDAAVDYTSNGVLRAFEIFHQVSEEKELGLDKIVTRSFLEGIKFHTAEFEKSVKDEFIKPLRYAFSSNSAIKYGSMYRGFERLENGVPIYKEKPLADHMFGDIVMHDIREDALKGRLKVMKYSEEKGEVVDVSGEMVPMERYKEYLNTAEARTRLVKNIARARIAAELKHHRERWGPAARWNADMINKFMLALETMQALEINEHGEVVETNRRFFTDEDLGWIRQNSGTGYKKMIVMEGSASLGKGIGTGLVEGIKEFFEDIFK